MHQLFLAITALLFCSSALAFPLPKAGLFQSSISPYFSANYDFEGIVSLSNCSGALIRLENSRETDVAMVLTNGHCLETGMPNPGAFVYGKPSTRSFQLFNSNGRVGRLTATQIIYSTMTKTDMTLYKLKETYAEIKSKYGVNALILDSKHPALSDPMEVISGYWNRGYSCNIEAFVNQLKEAGYVMNDSIRYTRPGCEVIGGTSGSPILRKGTRTVIGVNNTGNEDGLECRMNNPCEIDEQGNVTAHKDYSYGQQTYNVYTCLNQYNEVDLNVPGCDLFH